MNADLAAPVSADVETMLPLPYRVVERHVETGDSATLVLAPVRDAIGQFRAGQFTMLYAAGVGEVAISISGDPTTADGTLTQTIRDVGAVSRALHDAAPGTVLGVRGPFGTGWDVEAARGMDAVVVAGGVGLAPLRPVVLSLLAERSAYRRVVLIAGARSPGEFLFRDQLAEWAARGDLEVLRTVDAPADGWDGPVGFVTEPLSALNLHADRTVAFVCGPEAMMRFCSEGFARKGVPAERVRVSLERNMKCGIALCGHCQLGPLLVCRDGPVVGYDVAEPLMMVREL